MKNILMSMVLIVVVFFATSVWAAQTKVVNVTASIPVMSGGLSATVNKIVGTTWTPATAISFGTLVWDSVNSIFLPPMYYAIDVGVVDNSGTAWTVTHTRTSLANGSANLNDKVNVSFNKQTDSLTSTNLKYVSYGNSSNVSYTKAALSGGWLRIYYGIGTGDPDKLDAPGVTPIGLDAASGNYTGTVTITLTP